MNRLCAKVVLSFVCAAASMAATAAPTVFTPALQMVGEARLNVMFWSVYDSRLYTADGRYRADQRPLRLEIEYLREIEAHVLVKQTGEEWDHLQVAHENRNGWMRQLIALWPDVRKNDVIALEIDADNRSTFFFNGEKLGVIEDRAFGEHFVAIWLSPNTSRPALREALLGSL
ncbi:MAG: chalcone isomerase family protein [Haliea sp.]|jgi:hypothetical protein|nr:chalcone isomerase family protein [Haliea sp.]